jgi:hypothetical protein
MNQHWAHTIARLVQEAAHEDPHVRPISLEVATVICGGFRDLVLSTLDQGRDPTELQPVGRDLLVRLAERTTTREGSA